MNKDSQGFNKTSDSANVIPVVKTMTADLLTPLAVYLKLARGAENAFLLESVEGGENLARFSFIGANPFMTVRGNHQEVFIRKRGVEENQKTPIFDYLRNHFSGFIMSEQEDLPSFAGGAIGYFGFSCAEWFEPSLRNGDSTRTEAEFMFYRTFVAFDHAKQLIRIVSLVFTDEAENDAMLENLFQAAAEINETIKARLENEPVCLPRTETGKSKTEIRSNWTRENFENAVREIKELIGAGECYQVVLSQRFSRKTTADEIFIYRALRSLNPSPYMFLLKLGERSLIGASPEMLVRCRGKNLEYRPIAGTRKRGANAAEDSALAEEMRADKKEVAEHLMLVDLGRNDLGRVARYGSVEVKDLMSVEKFSHVQHLVSYLFAELRDGCDRFDALAACFPAGTVSGAPKVRAIQIINELEPTERGIYSGAVGYIDYSGNLDTCIAIRTLELENGEARIQAGAGIVADSVPEAEFEETVNKAKALLKTIEIAESHNF